MYPIDLFPTFFNFSHCPALNLVLNPIQLFNYLFNKNIRGEYPLFLLQSILRSLLRSILLKTPTLVGLDIQADAIRLLQLRPIKKPFKKIIIEQAIKIALPAGAMTLEKIQQPELVGNCLQELIVRSTLKNVSAIIALPAHCVTSKRIQLAKELGELERETEITDNLTDYLPNLSGNLCCDYVKLDAYNETQDNIFLVAASIDSLNSYVDIIKKSSAKLSIVDVDSYALARAVCLSTTVQAIKTKIILDISSSVARLMLLHQNEIIFHQIISHDHEKLKHAIQLCLSSYHQFTICTIFLSGSEENSLSIIHFLKETFSIETRYINVFENIVIPPDIASEKNKWSIAFGLALRSITGGSMIC